jgi:transglutaminase-like putative cysteine protease
MLAAEERPKMEWGEVPLEHLQMTSFPADTNANAVILFDYGEASFDADFAMKFTRHTRIKILKKAGFEKGTCVLNYYAGKHGEKVWDIEGLTTTLGPDGKTTQTELESKEIFEEKYSTNWRRVRFTLPALTEGCVIEYKYTRKSENPNYLPDWDFQTDEPVLWSEYFVKASVVFQYAVIKYGSNDYAISDTHHEKQSFLGVGGHSMMNVQIMHYARSNVEALRSEPYITTLDDYRARIKFQLTMITWPGERSVRYAESWPKLVNELLQDKHIGGVLSGSRTTRKFAEALTDTMKEPMLKMIALYDFVKGSIVWEDDGDFLAAQDVDDIFESKKGSSAEINLLLVAMLREAGIDADPVLTSTRGHGRITKVWPVFSNFNYLIARANVGGSSFLLDATDRYRPYTILPVRALNHEGLLLKAGPETWVPIQQEEKTREATIAKVSLAADGSLRGTVQMSFGNHRAFEERNAQAGKKEEDFVKHLLKSETSGIVADSFSISNRENITEPFVVDAKVSSVSCGQALNDFIYVNPMLFERTTENPFKLANRSFPVDMPYGISWTYRLTMTIPEGYVIKEYPPSYSTGLPMNGGSFRRSTEIQGNTFELMEHLEISQTFFEASKYQNIRLMYEQIVGHEAEQLVLAKYVPPAPVQASAPVTPVRASKKKK